MKYYILDNNDSFVYNLAAYFEALGHEIIVENVENIDVNNLNINNFNGIIISPGPGTPEQAIVSTAVVKSYVGQIPILGVCLGHQVIGYCFGATVKKGKRPMHGKVSILYNDGKGLFNRLPPTFNITRYHSLVIDKSTLPEEFIVDAVTEDQEIMAISHVKYPLYGVQFHPEALLSEYGYELLSNFNEICEMWERRNA